MTLQWTAVAVFLYAEIGFIILMMLPWIRPQTWSKFFKSQFVRSISHFSYIYKYAVGGILLLLLFDAIREVRKYAAVDVEMDLTRTTGGADARVHMRLFRAQRNLYISGFAIFLALIIRRLITLIVNEARLMASVDASLKQAASASVTAQQLMHHKDPKKSSEIAAKDEEKLKREITELRQKVKDTESERDTIREQAEDHKKEYETLADEYSRLDKVLKRTGDLRGKNK